MSFGICLHFEDNDRDVWSGRAIDLDVWRLALKAFGGDRLAVVNLCGAEITLQDETITIEEYTSLEAFLDVHRAEELVYVEFGGPSLLGFEHPAACWYVFGGTTFTLPKSDVEVPTLGVALHPLQISQIVTWDRFCKEHAG